MRVKNIRYCSDINWVPGHGEHGDLPVEAQSTSLYSGEKVACMLRWYRKTRCMRIVAADRRSSLNIRTDWWWALPDESSSSIALPSESCRNGRPRSH